MFDALATGGALMPEREIEVTASPLGQLLVERGHLTDQQLDSALVEQSRSGLPLGQVLIGLSYATAATIAQALATQKGGLVKTEFGLATGFGTPGLVALPPVSPPAAVPFATLRIEQGQPKAEAPRADVVPLRTPEPVPAVPARNEALEDATAKIAALELELAAASSAGSSLEAAESKISKLESDLADARMDAARIPALEVDLAAARRAETERDAHAADLAQARSQLTYAAESLTAAYERLQQYEAAWATHQAQLAQQPPTASPFAWQS
jgi:DNA repair exonuclease SbcCD ATPase subunit